MGAGERANSVHQEFCTWQNEDVYGHTETESFLFVARPTGSAGGTPGTRDGRSRLREEEERRGEAFACCFCRSPRPGARTSSLNGSESSAVCSGCCDAQTSVVCVVQPASHFPHSSAFCWCSSLEDTRRRGVEVPSGVSKCERVGTCCVETVTGSRASFGHGPREAGGWQGTRC